MEILGKKLFFLLFYTSLLAGILLSTVFILSSLSGRPIDSVPWLQTSLYHDSIVKPQIASSKRTWHAPSAGTSFPPLESFRLTKEMVESVAKDNSVVVTFGTHMFLDFILNWVNHLTDVNVFNLLVGAMDRKVLEELHWKGIPVFDMSSNNVQVNADGLGSIEFSKLGREKVLLLNALLQFGVEVLLSDSDVVWLKNPFPYFARFPEADVLTSHDQLSPTVTDERLEVWNEVSGLNIGIFYWRPTDPAIKLAKEWIDTLLADDSKWDQAQFHVVVLKKHGPTVGNNGLVYAYDGTLKLGLLPTSLFCSGHAYFVQRMPQQLRLEPYAVHTTYQYSGIDGKRSRFREAMMFLDPPEYFDVPGGFLSFKQSIPRNLFLGGEHTVETHFSLVNYQLKQIRTALAVASVLNRTLVMPPIWCRLDKFWFGHPGIIPLTLTNPPFICPLDHVFEVDKMLSALSEAEYGPRIDFREYSFLENPLLPKQVKETLLEVQVCEDLSTNCVHRTGVIGFPKQGNEEMFRQVFSSHKDAKVIQFSSMEDIFEGFTDKGREEKFRKRVKMYTSAWCCLQNRNRGHIYYDIYWDEKPGWKPKPPENAEKDHRPF